MTTLTGLWNCHNSMLVLVNRFPYEHLPEKEIRQEDPISPYIFIIYAEYLDRYVHFIFTIHKY